MAYQANGLLEVTNGSDVIGVTTNADEANNPRLPVCDDLGRVYFVADKGLVSPENAELWGASGVSFVGSTPPSPGPSILIQQPGPQADVAVVIEGSGLMTTAGTPGLEAGVPSQGAWTLDGVGNWEQVDAETRQHTSFNEVAARDGVARLHDANGNVLDDGVFEYVWDYRNRLRDVIRKSDNAVVARYRYDALDRRVRKSVSGSGELNGVTRYQLAGWQVLQEADGLGALERQFVYGRGIDEPLELARNLDGDATTSSAGDERLFYHQNTLGSVFALTDEGGNVVEAYQYDAYGGQTVFANPGGGIDVEGADATIAGGTQLENPYGFTGRRLDAETGRYFNRYRYLDPDAGRFLSRDPMGYAAGSLGLYEYAGGRPTQYVDPMGLGPKQADGVGPGATNVFLPLILKQ